MSIRKIEDLLERKEQYRTEIISLIKRPEAKVAYHFNCPDGFISAAIFRYMFSSKELIYIPFDYALFKDDEVIKESSKTNWFAIVDLEPFNSKSAEYFIDHHISNKEKEMNAKHINYEAGAPSAAYLIEKIFSAQLPDYIKELVEISKITDTASYEIPAPLTLQEDPDNLSWDEKIWFLQDACKTTFLVKDHDELIEILAFEGWNGLWKEHILQRVRNLRLARKKSVEVAQNIVITDFVVVIDHPLHLNLAFIANEVMKRGATGAAFITEYPDEVKVSLRLSRALPEELVEKYRVDLLANSMDGGGHKGASGAEADNMSDVLEKIRNWSKKVGLNMSIVDFR